LTLAKMQLTGIDVHSLESKSERARELLTRAIGDLRQLSKSINGSYMLDHGLEEAIRKELCFAAGQDIRRTILDWTDETIQFDAQTEVILFRSIQEAINNAVKHADASELKVTMVSQNREYTITIADDGKGMSEEQIVKSVGFKSLETRMLALKGSFRVDTVIGHGTSIVLNFEYDRLK
jgi:two-component system, NarL family, sensor kinase